MSRYIHFTKLKHLIFPNGGSIWKQSRRGACLNSCVVAKDIRECIHTHSSCTCLPDLCWCVSISVTFAASILAARVRVSSSLSPCMPTCRAAWGCVVGPTCSGTRARGSGPAETDPFPMKGELLRCPSMADTHAEFSPRDGRVHVNGHVRRAEALALGSILYFAPVAGLLDGYLSTADWPDTLPSVDCCRGKL
jgi:hypothetical protein